MLHGGGGSLVDGLLEHRAGRELRHGRRPDLDLLARVARVDTHAGRPMRGVELAEPGEVHRLARLQRLLDGLEECVHCGACVALGEAALSGHCVYELLLRHFTPPARWSLLGPPETLTPPADGSTMPIFAQALLRSVAGWRDRAFAGLRATHWGSARRGGRSPDRGRGAAPPSSRGRPPHLLHGRQRTLHGGRGGRHPAAPTPS